MNEAIRNCPDSKDFDVVFMDLQNAFDTVNHNILCSKLEHYAIKGNALRWLQSCLADKKQSVSMH